MMLVVLLIVMMLTTVESRRCKSHKTARCPEGYYKSIAHNLRCCKK